MQDYPAKVAHQLLEGSIDLGLVPVAVIPKLSQYHIIGNYCIGCTGEVASVCLFSEVPLSAITHIWVDYQSRTSAALLKILLREHWQINPQLLDATAGYEQQIEGTTAGLVIGDRALAMRSSFKYGYDLGQGWYELTELPFVFAAWVASQPLPADFIQAFDAANEAGMAVLPQLADAIPHPAYDLYQYYTQNIEYRLDAAKQKGLDFFLQKLEAGQQVFNYV